MNPPEPSAGSEQFRYLMWTVSVIVGLGITTLLRGVGQLLTTRVKVDLFLPHLCYVALLFVVLVEYWWGMWQWRESSWEFGKFLFALLSPASLYLVSILLLPEIPGKPVDRKEPIDPEKRFDLKDHFFAYRPWFFRLAAFATLLSIVESVIYTRQFSWLSFFTALNGIRITVVILFSLASVIENPRFHYCLPWPFVILLIAFIVLKQAQMAH